jgi:hypothetical protein
MSENKIQAGSFETEIKTFLKFLYALKTLVSEARLHIRKGEVNVAAVDSANVAMVVAKMEIRNTEGIGEDEVLIGIDVYQVISPIRKLLDSGLAGPSDLIKVCWTPGEEQPILDIEAATGAFHLRFDTLNHNSIRKDPGRTDFKGATGFSCDGLRLATCVLICAEMSDKFRFDVLENGSVFVAAKGDGNCQCRIPLTSKSHGPAAIAMYSLDYFQDIVKFWKDGRPVIAFATDRPVSFTGITAEGIHVMHAVAPRLLADDDDAEARGWM